MECSPKSGDIDSEALVELAAAALVTPCVSRRQPSQQRRS
jgi:hypothetical protein